MDAERTVRQQSLTSGVENDQHEEVQENDDKFDNTEQELYLGTECLRKLVEKQDAIRTNCFVENEDNLGREEKEAQDEEEEVEEGNEDEEENVFKDKNDDSDVEEMEEVRLHPSYQQVLLDVNRCAGRLEHIRQCYLHRTDDDADEPPEDLTEQLQRISDDKLDTLDNEKALIVNHEDSQKLERIARDLKYQRKLKRRLSKLILKLLLKKPDMHYYQGFHDVCLTYMIIYGHEEAFNKLDSIIDTHFSAFMQPTMHETQEFLNLIPIIIGLHDFKVQDFLDKAEVGTIFALSWVITWFSHVIPNERDVEFIYSRLEQTSDPHLILYLCASIVLYKRDQLIQLEPEMSTIHKFLSLVPRKEELPISDLLDDASSAFKRWPPDYVKKQLDKQKQTKLQVHNFNILSSLAHRFAPGLANMVQTSNTRTAIIVFVVASALALQFDRWLR